MSGLMIVNKLIEKLHIDGIIYCHWKSNEHLKEAMMGLTDLDILVEKRAFLKLNQILSEMGYKRFVATSYRTYPAIEDFLALDKETGKLVHLHLHYELTIGEKHLKGYRLPWESLVLSTRQLNTEHNIYVTDPNVEMALLFVRTVLKIRTRDHLFALSGKAYFSRNILVEFDWLKERIQSKRVAEIVHNTLGEESASLMLEMLFSKPSSRQLLAFRKSVKKGMRLYRTYGFLEALYLKWLRELRWLVGVINNKCFHRTKPYRRTIPHGGLLVAFMGSDGSGKSTLTQKTVNWLSWKVDVVQVYFGSGQGPSSLIRWPLLLTSNLLIKPIVLRMKFKNVNGDKKCNHVQGKQRGLFLKTMGKVFEVLWALTLACEKREKICRAWRARNLGIFVICDRYPQSQIMGFNDGPLLSYWLDNRWRLFRALALWELNSYQRSEKMPPDLVIKLDVTPEVAHLRKKDMSAEEIRNRVKAVKSLQYPPETRTVIINTDESIDKVILGVKQVIWESI